MATTISLPDRVATRREAVIGEALDHAQAIVEEDGAGAVTVSEVARRLGIRAPSLYKYFPSLHALYDALFARGNALVADYIEEATRDSSPGLERLLASSRAMVRWSLSEPGLGALLFWRPVPGFVPSPESYAPSQELWLRWRGDLSTAAEHGDLAVSADTEDAMRLLTSLISGICSQQMANDPGASYERGAFTSLTDSALEMFVAHHLPRRTTGRKKDKQ